MSTPPPVPPDMPEPPPIRGAIPPVPPPIPAQPYPPIPLVKPPAGPPPVSLPVPPARGTGTRGLLYGCLGLLAVAGILIAFGSMWVFKKAKGIAQNPEQFIAEMAVKANPDLELVSVDKAAQEVVIKNKQSGESTTFSFEEVKQGMITVKTSKGSSAEIGTGGIRLEDKDGRQAEWGSGAAVPLSAWVPAYPGGHRVLMSSHRLKGRDEVGQYSFTTPDSIDAATANYLKVLEAAAFEVTQESTSTNGSKVLSLEATAALDGGGSQRIVIRLMGQGKATTTVNLDYSHGAATGDEPVEN